MPRLFISRSLTQDSPLLQWALRRGIEVMDQSLLRFSPLPFRLPQQPFDWIFFYSPRAVQFFWTPIAIGRGRAQASQAKLAAIGPGTARSLASLGYKLSFVGNGHPVETAEAFAERAAGQTILFPRAQQSRRSVEYYLGDRVRSIDLVVYQNEAIPPIHPIAADVIILTSPLNTAAWFTTHPQATEEQHFIALGPSTAAAMKKCGVEPKVAPSPTDEGLLAVVKGLI